MCMCLQIYLKGSFVFDKSTVSGIMQNTYIVVIVRDEDNKICFLFVLFVTHANNIH